MAHRRESRPAARQDTGLGVAELVAEPGRPRAWTLLVNGAPQSHVDLDDPRRLEFEYVRRIGHVIDLAAAAGEPLRVLHLGAGALTLARYVTATRPASRQLAVEADAALVEFVRTWLPLRQPARRGDGGRAGRVPIRVADARAALETLGDGAFDVVIADLFTAERTPAHLTSAEFTAAAARVLGPAGVYVANVADGPPLAHARARVATARSVFPHVCMIADAAVLRGRRFGNLVVAASRQALPAAGLTRRAAADPFPGRVVDGSDLDRFAAGVRAITDAAAEPSPAPPPGMFAAR